MRLPARSLARHDRLVLAVATLAAITPIIVDAVRMARWGWVPSDDSAATVLRARHALGLHPTLVGMYTDASLWTGHTTYFPAAWQLYWLWGPTRLLGTTWGPLLAMAVLNGIWIGLAAWMVAHLQGTRAALLAIAFFAVLNLSLGMTALHAATPMIMVLAPYAAMLFGSWALASGDVEVLPALALVANYLVLSHLVLSMLVPVLVVVSMLCCAVWLVRDARRDPETRGALVARLRRPVIGAVGVTVLAWIPPIVQQVGNRPGNLVELWRASKVQPDSIISHEYAARAVFSLLTRPPFWLPGSRSNSIFSLTAGLQPVRSQLIIGGIGVIGALALAGLAIRARDRSGLAAIVVASAALVASWLNMARSPSKFGLSGRYFLSTWPLSMFVTFALVFNVARRLAPVWRRWPGVKRAEMLAGCAVVCVVAALSIPHSNHEVATTEPSDAQSTVDRQVVAGGLAAARGRGPMRIARPSVDTYPTAVALALAFDAAGIAFCVDGIDQLAGAPVRSCDGFDHRRTLTVFRLSQPASQPAGSRSIVVAQPLDATDLHRLERLRKTVRRAAEQAATSGRKITLSREFRTTVTSIMRDQRAEGARALQAMVQAMVQRLNTPAGITSTAEGRAALAEVVTPVTTSAGHAITNVQVPGLADDVLIEWARLERRWSNHAVALAMSPG